MIPHALRRELEACDCDSLAEVHSWITALLSNLDAITPAPAYPSEPGVYTSAGSYQLERIRCGRVGCHCTTGQGHGPYWYHYYKSGGKRRSRYVGKNLNLIPQEVHRGTDPNAP